MAKKHLIIFLLSLSSVCKLAAQDDLPFDQNAFDVEFSGFAIREIDNSIYIVLQEGFTEWNNATIPAIVNGENVELHFEKGKAQAHIKFDRNEPLSIKIGGFTYVKSVTPMPLWLSIVPPLIVIFLALVFKEVISSLAIGVTVGAGIISYFTPGVSVWSAPLTFFDTYVLNAFADADHAAVILFSLMIAATVALVSRNGGMAAIVQAISTRVRDSKSAQLATWFMGIAIFFDDYANTLVVGNTMRPVTDRMRVSREKLSFIVDSTAAPVCAVAFITTWIGAELGYIDEALAVINAGSPKIDVGAYGVFLNSLQYAFYPILCLIFILLIVLMKRDYGPMWKAETKARKGEMDLAAPGRELDSDMQPSEGTPLRIINAALPIGLLIVTTVVGLIYTGYDAAIWADTGIGLSVKLSKTVGGANAYQALLWASLVGFTTALALTVAQRIMTFTKAIETGLEGFKTMAGAMSILVLAWSLAQVTSDVHTGEFLAGVVSGKLAPWMLAPGTFLLAGLVAFSTGTSWGTMAILYPLILPLSWKLSIDAGLDPQTAFMMLSNCTACVLAGSVLGDHCSPISDTTILSSLASQCNHLDHVKTQLPYALSVGAVATVLSALAGVFEINGWVLFPLGIGLLFTLIRLLGKPVSA